MKDNITIIVSILLAFDLQAQNVGVNTTTPQASLDVRGTERVGGLNNYTLYDSSTGRIQWVGAALYAPASQQIIRHSASAEGLYAGGGRIEYRNTTAAVFYSEWGTGNGYFKNNLGINNLTPQFPLSFNNALGDKIALWTDGTAAHYGFGIQAGLLQMFSNTSTDDIAFGYGGSSAFVERMRIKGNGNVGIGNNPGYLLDVNGRMRVRSGGSNGTSAGMWLNSNSNVEVSFIGMEDDTHVGFFGNNGAGWKFAMNTQTGALQLNGSEGNAGQVIQSNGSSAPTWSSSTNTLYNNTVSITDATQQLLQTSLGFVPLIGMTYSFSTGGNAKVMVSYSIPVASLSCAFCGASTSFIDIILDGGVASRVTNDIANGSTTTVATTRVFTVGAGSHTVYLQAEGIGNTVAFGSNSTIIKAMTVQIIPQ